MSNVIKVIIVLIVLAGGAWVVMLSGWLNKPQPVVTRAPAVATTTPAAPAPVPNMNGMAAANDASEMALLQDTAAVNTQMQGLTSDSASLDASLNDKPMPQAY